MLAIVQKDRQFLANLFSNMNYSPFSDLSPKYCISEWNETLSLIVSVSQSQVSCILLLLNLYSFLSISFSLSLSLFFIFHIYFYFLFQQTTFVLRKANQTRNTQRTGKTNHRPDLQNNEPTNKQLISNKE